MKKLLLLTMALVLVISLGACAATEKVKEEASEAVEEVKETAESVVDEAEGAVSKAEETVESVVGEAKDAIGEAEERLANLLINDYADLKVDAVIKERMAILPGNSFNVDVIITNSGDKPIGYVKGSGTAVVPSALKFISNDIQAVPPVESLGAMTMDFRVEVLQPGEKLEFVQSFIAIKPTDDFAQKAMDYQQSTGEYIGSKSLDELAGAVEGLTAVDAGQYNIKAYFEYTVLDSTEDLSPVNEPTSANFFDLNVSVG